MNSRSLTALAKVEVLTLITLVTSPHNRVCAATVTLNVQMDNRTSFIRRSWIGRMGRRRMGRSRSTWTEEGQVEEGRSKGRSERRSPGVRSFPPTATTRWSGVAAIEVGTPVPMGLVNPLHGMRRKVGQRLHVSGVTRQTQVVIPARRALESGTNERRHLAPITRNAPVDRLAFFRRSLATTATAPPTAPHPTTTNARNSITIRVRLGLGLTLGLRLGLSFRSSAGISVKKNVKIERPGERKICKIRCGGQPKTKNRSKLRTARKQERF